MLFNLNKYQYLLRNLKQYIQPSFTPRQWEYKVASCVPAMSAGPMGFPFHYLSAFSFCLTWELNYELLRNSSPITATRFAESSLFIIQCLPFFYHSELSKKCNICPSVFSCIGIEYCESLTSEAVLSFSLWKTFSLVLLVLLLLRLQWI